MPFPECMLFVRQKIILVKMTRFVSDLVVSVPGHFNPTSFISVPGRFGPGRFSVSDHVCICATYIPTYLYMRLVDHFGT